MISLKILVYSLWLMSVVIGSVAEECRCNNEIPMNIEVAPFTDQLRDIEDLLRMFIAIINKASAEKGLELNLPGTTPPMPQDTGYESLEDLFDKFDLAVRSFRERFLYLVNNVSYSFVSIDEKLQNDNGTKPDDKSKYDLENEVSTDETFESEKGTWSTEAPNTVWKDSFESDLQWKTNENNLFNARSVAFDSTVKEISDDTSTLVPVTNGNEALIAEITFTPSDADDSSIVEAGFTIDEESVEEGKKSLNYDSITSTEENELKETLHIVPSTRNDDTIDEMVLTEEVDSDIENTSFLTESDKGKRSTEESTKEKSITKRAGEMDEKPTPIKIRKVISSNEDLLEVYAHILRFLDKNFPEHRRRHKREYFDGDEVFSDEDESYRHGWRRFSLHTEEKMLNALDNFEESEEEFLAALLFALEEGGLVELGEMDWDTDSHSSEPQGHFHKLSDRSGLMPEHVEFPNLDITGVPGIDFPNYSNIPETSFTCHGKQVPGLYADLDTQCQVFHACWHSRIESYLCPPGTTFNQRIVSCDLWYNSTCSNSPAYYFVNEILKKMGVDREDYVTYLVEETQKNPPSFTSMPLHPIFKEMTILPIKYKSTKYSRSSHHTGRKVASADKDSTEFDKDSNVSDMEDLSRNLFKSWDDEETVYNSKFAKRKQFYNNLPKPKISKPKVSSESLTLITLEPVNTRTPNSSESTSDAELKLVQKQIALKTVANALKTVENVPGGILSSTRDMLVASYSKLYKPKKI